jgi:dolichol-phosphate mannosyltransferase
METTEQKMRFCLIIPMYNEAGNVLPCIQGANEAIRTYGLDADIQVVNDGSSDATAHELLGAQRLHPNVFVETHPKNQGFGVARRTGIRAALARGGYEFVMFMDADLTMDPKYCVGFHDRIRDGYDFVIGSRFVEGGGMDKVPFRRAVVSWVGGTIFRLCFRLGIHDYTQGFRAIRASIAERLHLTETGFPVVMQEIYQARRYTRKFAEVPFVLSTRTVGVSKFNYTPAVFGRYLCYAFLALFPA